MCEVTVENGMEVSETLKQTELLCDPAIPPPGICLEKKKKENTNSRRYMHPNVHSSIIHNS